MSYATLAQLREALPNVPERAQQRVTVTGSPTGGTFTLTYEGVASAAIAYGARASAVKTALNAVSTIGGDVATVSGPAGGPWVVTFAGTVGNDASPLVLGTNSLTGGSAPSVAIAPATDDALQAALDRATAIIDTEVGYSFAAAAAGTRAVYGDGTAFLLPPRFVAGSVSGVTAPSGYLVPDYIEQDGMLVVTDADGVRLPDAHRMQRGWAWDDGVAYTVAATFGGVPADIVECCLEIAVRLWRGRAAGFSDVVGVEGGGAVGYERALPALVRRILDQYREERAAGVW